MKLNVNNGGHNTPILSIVGYSGSGKTTLIVRLIEILSYRGFHVGTIKHDVHGFEMDRPGKDSWRHKRAGSIATIVSSPSRIGMVMDVDHDHQPFELLQLFPELDIILVEGFKRAEIPKIEVFRAEIQKPPACRDDKNLIAVVSNKSLDWGVPCFILDEIDALTDFITDHFKLSSITKLSLKMLAN